MVVNIDGLAGPGGTSLPGGSPGEDLCSLWQISAEKTKLMTNNANGISMDIRINSEKLDKVKSFKYLSAVITDQGSKHEVLSRIAQTTAALARLKTIWNDKYISLRPD